MKILDLFCGLGGACRGYQLAGFEVVGVDLVDQPEYPGKFIRANALTFDLTGFDALHGSPPCKRWTVLRKVHESRQSSMFDPHPDLLTPTREMFNLSGLPYVIENVVGAPLLNPAVYCGSSFGLMVRRHRLFETNWRLVAPSCNHAAQPVVLGVYGTGGDWKRTAPGGGGQKVSGQKAAEALGVDWSASQKGLSQAIPPAYTHHIGRQLLAHINQSEAAS